MLHDIRLRTPMSAAIPCTRATAQRVAFRAIRCKRYASTETVVVDAAPTTALPPATKREQRLPREDLSQRLHRALYPEYYGENGQPINGALKTHIRRKQPSKPISAKWEAVMKQKNVNHVLSTPFPLHTPHTRPPSANPRTLQATNSASQSSSNPPATSRKHALTPSPLSQPRKSAPSTPPAPAPASSQKTTQNVRASVTSYSSANALATPSPVSASTSGAAAPTRLSFSAASSPVWASRCGTRFTVRWLKA